MCACPSGWLFPWIDLFLVPFFHSSSIGSAWWKLLRSSWVSFLHYTCAHDRSRQRVTSTNWVSGFKSGINNPPARSMKDSKPTKLARSTKILIAQPPFRGSDWTWSHSLFRSSWVGNWAQPCQESNYNSPHCHSRLEVVIGHEATLLLEVVEEQELDTGTMVEQHKIHWSQNDVWR